MASPRGQAGFGITAVAVSWCLSCRRRVDPRRPVGVLVVARNEPRPGDRTTERVTFLFKPFFSEHGSLDMPTPDMGRLVRLLVRATGTKLCVAFFTSFCSVWRYHHTRGKETGDEAHADWDRE